MSPITQTPIPLSDEWATPKWLFDHFDAEFRFTLDACAKPWNAKCAEYVTATTPFSWPWARGQVVWMNPPYSDLDAWMRKAYIESSQRGSVVVCLVPCVPDRKWWSAHVEGKAEVRHLTRTLLPSGRVHFEKEDGTSGRAPFPSCIVVFRPRAELRKSGRCPLSIVTIRSWQQIAEQLKRLDLAGQTPKVVDARVVKCNSISGPNERDVLLGPNPVEHLAIGPVPHWHTVSAIDEYLKNGEEAAKCPECGLVGCWLMHEDAIVGVPIVHPSVDRANSRGQYGELPVICRRPDYRIVVGWPLLPIKP